MTEPIETKNALAIVKQSENAVASFDSSAGFDLLNRVGSMFAKSDMVPAGFKNNPANCIIGVELARRVGANPLMVMQNLNIIHGRPTFSGQFAISAVNQCGQFSKKLRFKFTGSGDEKTCVAWTVDHDGEVLEGPPVSIGMAKKEGWSTRNGSKWQTMPDLMMMYRAGTFFCRAYAPEILMGFRTTEEVEDMGADAAPEQTTAVSSLNERISARVNKRKKEETTIEAVAVEAEPGKVETAEQPEASNADFF